MTDDEVRKWVRVSRSPLTGYELSVFSDFLIEVSIELVLKVKKEES